MKKRLVYLDHAAATPLDSRVREAMLPFLEQEFGNPSALYGLGRSAREAVDRARESVARVFNCRAAEVIFTGSGTESDNLAILGVARQNFASQNLGGQARGHLITTNIEHHAVLNPCQVLEKEGYARCHNSDIGRSPNNAGGSQSCGTGYEVTYLKVDRDGLVAPEQLKAAIQTDTILISIMYANNEIGTIEPIAELTRTLREWKKKQGRKENDPPFFHTDACQAAGYLDLNIKNLGVDLLTINGSKIYGPKGVGALFVRRGLRLKPLVYGGGQEFGLRSGTENVAGIVGLGCAMEEITKLRNYEIARLTVLRDKLIAGILERVPQAQLNGHATLRLPNNANVSILGIEGQAMLLYLDEYGIAASTGSACEAAGPDPSHVVQALGKSLETARSSIRFTLGRSTTQDDVDYVLRVLPEIVNKLLKL